MSVPFTWGYCLVLKNQECKIRKVVVDNDYMTFPYKIAVYRCIRSCNYKNNLYYKVSLPKSVKNITVKSLDLISQEFVLKNISFHQSCKCGCLLDEKVCTNLQKWNVDKCRCECLKIKNCNIGYSWNVDNCRCKIKKLAALIESVRFLETEECDAETDEISDCKALPENKTITLIKKIKNCKSFVSISILFIYISIILIGIMIYFCLKLNNNVLPY